MPNINASLDVRNFPSNGSDGYTDTIANNNAVYSYKYSGGSDGAGGLETRVGSGVATLNLNLDADNRYSFSTVDFTDDDEQQLSWRGNAPTAGVITDANTKLETAHYSVTVADATGNCTFPCDPTVSNEPNNPMKGLIRHTH